MRVHCSYFAGAAAKHHAACREDSRGPAGAKHADRARSSPAAVGRLVHDRVDRISLSAVGRGGSSERELGVAGSSLSRRANFDPACVACCYMTVA